MSTENTFRSILLEDAYKRNISSIPAIKAMKIDELTEKIKVLVLRSDSAERKRIMDILSSLLSAKKSPTPVPTPTPTPAAEVKEIGEIVKGLHQQVSRGLASKGNSLGKRRSIAEMKRMIEQHLATNIPANARKELEEIHTMANTYLRDYVARTPRTRETKSGYNVVTPAAKSQVSGNGKRWTMTKGSRRNTRRSKHRK
jgi:hypothetical protein